MTDLLGEQPAGNFVFVPVVEEFEELPTDLVLYAPGSGTARRIVAWYQNALGSEPWPWKEGGWNNLSEALQHARELGYERIVIKHQRLPNGLDDADRRSYIAILAEFARGDCRSRSPVVLVFPEKRRQEVLRALG